MAFTQPWSGILNANRAADWTQAGFTIVEPALQCANQVGTYSPSGGDDAASINALIAGCTNGGYILLGPGTFNFSSDGLKFNAVNNVVLRGTGPNSTKLLMTTKFNCDQAGYACIWGNTQTSGFYFAAANWTGDNGSSGSYAKGNTVIDLSSTNGLHVGQMLMLDQKDDSFGFPTSGTGCSESGSTVTCNTTIAHNFSVGDLVAVGGKQKPTNNDCGQGTNIGYNGWWVVTAINVGGQASPFNFQYTDTNTGLSTCTGGYASKDNGGFFSTGVENTTIVGNPSIGRVCPSPGTADPSCQAGEVSQRSQTEVHVVTNIGAANGCGTGCTQVTIAPPIFMPNWRTSQAPGAYWTASSLAGYSIGDGIENLTIDSSTGSTASGGTVQFLNAYKCWLKNTRVISGDTQHVTIHASMSIDILNNYFVGTRNGTNQTYGVDDKQGSNDLIQNNLFQHIPSPLINEGSYGDVIAYNYIVDGAYNSVGTLLDSLSNHGFGGFNLFEGNNVSKLSLDDNHGQTTGMTLFRNRFRGQDTPVKTNSLAAAQICTYQRGENLIGNILGTSAYQSTGYMMPSSNSNIQINGYTYLLGSPLQTGTIVPYDPLVASSMLLWGNYDTVSGTVRWCGNSSDTGWGTTCSGAVVSGTYTSGGTITGSTGNTCILDLGGATATVALTGTNTISGGTALTITAGGQGYSSSPTSATLVNGTAVCSGTATVSTTLGSRSEIPSNSLPFISNNTVPTVGDTGSGQTPLPSSFYLSGLPPFWNTPSGAPPWPAIGPDVIGSVASDTVGGHSYAIPAQVCYQNTAIDSAYQTTYTITAASWSSAGGGTAVFTVGTNTAAVDDTVKVSGVNPSGYNGTWQVSGSNTTTISVLMPSNPGSYSSGGTMTTPNILAFDANTCYLTPNPSAIVGGTSKIGGTVKF